MNPFRGFFTLIIAVCTSASAQTELNHLTPIIPLDYSGYRNQIYLYLLPKRISESWMVAFPSHSPEYSISICMQRDKNDEPIYPNKYDLIFGEMNTHAWIILAPPPLPPGVKPVRRQNKKILKCKFQQTEIESNLAQSVIAAFAKMTKETKYADNPGYGCDGINYNFFSRPGYFGNAWSPTSGNPERMVKLSDEMINYVKASNMDRPNIAMRINLIVESIK